MREIEIKVQVESLESIREILMQRGVEITQKVTQHDVVWGLPDSKSGSGAPWLRLRTESREGKDERHLFTLKRSVTGQLDSIEHETEIKDPAVIAGIVRELGFTLYSDITKTRQKAHFGDIELCLDSVDTLGEFVEAEKLTDDSADFSAVSEELWQFFAEFGIGRANQVTDGYDVLINKQLGRE